LHIKPTTLNEMIKRYDIHPRRRRNPSNDIEPPSTDGADPARDRPPTVAGPLTIALEEK
jgi:hypothetical protein